MNKRLRLVIIGGGIGLLIVVVFLGIFFVSTRGNGSSANSSTNSSPNRSDLSDAIDPVRGSVSRGVYIEDRGEAFQTDFLVYDTQKLYIYRDNALQNLDFSQGLSLSTENIIPIPRENISYAILPQQPGDFILYKKEGKIYSYELRTQKEYQYSSGIEYADIDFSNRKAYGIENMATRDSSIYELSLQGNKLRTIIQKANIVWMQISQGNIFYKTSTNSIYRYEISTGREFLIKESKTPVYIELSPYIRKGVITTSETTEIYSYSVNTDSLTEIKDFPIYKRKIAWNGYTDEFFTYSDTALLKYNIQTQGLTSWDTQELSDIQYIAVVSDTQLVFQKNSSRNLYTLDIFGDQ